MIISIDAEKVFDIIQYLFMIKNTQKTRNRRKLTQHDKAIYEKSTVNILNDERLKAFRLRSGTR